MPGIAGLRQRPGRGRPQAGIVGADGSARDVHQAAARGDTAALALVARARQALATGARNLAAVHAADAVVLTGNALGDIGELVATVQSEVDRYPFAPKGGVMVTASTLKGTQAASAPHR